MVILNTFLKPCDQREESVLQASTFISLLWFYYDKGQQLKLIEWTNKRTDGWYQKILAKQ